MKSRLTASTLFLVFLTASLVGAQEAVPAAPDSLEGAAAPSDTLPPLPDILVLPPANHTQLGAAAELMEPLLYHHLQEVGFTAMDEDTLRIILRKHRIRTRGSIGYSDAETLGEVTGVRHLVIASWDIYKTAFNPELAFSIRILDLETMAIVAAVSQGASGEDYTGLMGLGTVHEISELAEMTMIRAFKGLFPTRPFNGSRPSSGGCFNFALIPLDNYSATPFAGDILTNILLSRLFSAGYFVVEPGFVKEVGLTREVVNRGRVDWGSARALLERFGSCRILTGEVEAFAPAPADPRVTVPSTTFGLRIMIPENGNLYMMKELQGAGDEGEGFFQGNRVHTLVSLVDGMLTEFLDELTETNRKDILHGRLRQSDP